MSLILQLPVDRITFLVKQVPHNHFSILVSRSEHCVVRVKTYAAGDVPWLLEDPVELLAHHVNDAEMTAKHPLHASL